MIALSAYGGAAIEAQARAAGFDAFLGKRKPQWQGK